MSYLVSVTYPKGSRGYDAVGAGPFSVAVCPTIERAREQRDSHKKRHASWGGLYKIGEPRRNIQSRLDRIKGK